MSTSEEIFDELTETEAGFAAEEDTKLTSTDPVPSPSNEGEAPAEAIDVLAVPIDELIVADVREERDDEAMAGLIESMRTIGLLSPILVTQEGDKFRVVCGRRRVRAAESLGWKMVPAILWRMDDVRKEMAVISENMHSLELTGQERDTAYLRYVQLYASLYPNAESDAQDRRLANVIKDEEVRSEILSRPVIDTPTEATAKAFGVKPPTVTKAVKRARSFTAAQRKILDIADVPDRQADVLANEDADTIENVVKLIAAGLAFDDAMRQVFHEQGRDYMRPSAKPATVAAPTTPKPGKMDDLLKSLPGRRAILDTEAFDGDVELFFKLAREIEIFKQKIDWAALEELHGQGPHGLYYRRLRLALAAPHPRSWSACGCQFNPDPNGPTNCPTCRGGGYQIGG